MWFGNEIGLKGNSIKVHIGIINQSLESTVRALKNGFHTNDVFGMYVDRLYSS